MPTVAIITPTYCEKDNIKELIEQVMGLNTNSLKIKLIVVDDASPDGTGKLVDELIEKYEGRLICIHRAKKLGFASATIEGFRYAINNFKDLDYIITMDSDLSHEPRYIPSIIKELTDFDVVIGSRYLGGRISVVNWPLKRLILSRLGNLYAKFVTGMKIEDCTSGFVGYKRRVIEEIGVNNIDDKIYAEGYSFLIELKYKAYTKRCKIKEVPIVFTERRSGVSKMSKKIMLEALFIVWLLKIKTLLKKLKRCFMA